MKYLKTLGLAVVAAMVVMAFAGAGSASATVLCKTTPVNNDCPKGWDYEAGTKIEATIEKGGSVLFEETSGNSVNTCGGGAVKGKTTSTGSGTETVTVPDEELTWSACTALITTIGSGSLEMHADDEHNASVTSKGIELTINTIFGSCFYGTGGSTPIGAIKSGEVATMEINSVFSKVSGAITCPATIRWTSKYKITSPSPLFFATTSA